MSWTFKPVINTGFSFSGDMVYNSSEIEVPDSVIKYINSVDNDIQSMYLDKYTGFETVKYQVRDSSLRHFSINFVGNMPRWVRDLLCELAIAVNGAGMVIQFRDTWVTGTDAVPVVYYCNWLNAGDFVDSNVLLSGANMELDSFSLPGATVITEYQKMIDIPANNLEWQYNISNVGVDEEYYRVI